MSRIRSLFLWLVVLILPLQGLAATSMLFCGMGEHHASAPQAVVAEPGMHAAHGEMGAHHAEPHQAHAAPAESMADASANAGKLGDLSHQCGLCASCCFQVAIAGQPLVSLLAAAPQADLAEPLVLIRALPSRVPERPPRA